jgi:predicted thioesterase
MEECCIKASDPYLQDGYAVDGLRHVAPTAIDQYVTIKSVLTEVDRNRLTYSIEAMEGDKQIGVATHKRAAIPME